MDDFHCHTCEDPPRVVKIPGHTRFSAGTYEIKLRTEGALHAKYAKRFPWHRGMLHLQDVPEFEWIYIHIGTNAKQTKGCILTGYTALSKRGFSLRRSLEAYRDLYKLVIKALDEGEQVFIKITD